MEPLENPVQPQAPAEERRLGSPESSPAAAAQEAPGAGPDPDPSGGQKLPSPRPARLRLLPAGLGYGAFRRPLSAAPEPPSPGPAAAEQPWDGEAAGTELVPRAAPEEPGPGSWAPVALQVDVLVKPVGAAGGSHAPSPAPSRRFITVPVPEPPASPRHAAPAGPLLPRTASLGSAWSRGSPLAAPRAEHGLAAEEGAAAPGAPTCRCRCQEPGGEDAALLRRAEPDGDLKLHRAIRLIGTRAPTPTPPWARSGGTGGPRRPSRCPAWLGTNTILVYVIIIQVVFDESIKPLFPLAFSGQLVHFRSVSAASSSRPGGGSPGEGKPQGHVAAAAPAGAQVLDPRPWAALPGPAGSGSLRPPFTEERSSQPLPRPHPLQPLCGSMCGCVCAAL